MHAAGGPRWRAPRLMPAFDVNGTTGISTTSKDGDKMITRGGFKGKKITYASMERIDEFAQLSSEFMQQVFDLAPGEYLISAESDLLDFTDMASSDAFDTWKRITKIYGVSQADVRSGRLVDIFAAIVQRQNLQ